MQFFKMEITFWKMVSPNTKFLKQTCTVALISAHVCLAESQCMVIKRNNPSLKKFLSKSYLPWHEPCLHHFFKYIFQIFSFFTETQNMVGNLLFVTFRTFFYLKCVNCCFVRVTRNCNWLKKWLSHVWYLLMKIQNKLLLFYA